VCVFVERAIVGDFRWSCKLLPAGRCLRPLLFDFAAAAAVLLLGVWLQTCDGLYGFWQLSREDTCGSLVRPGHQVPPTVQPAGMSVRHLRSPYGLRDTRRPSSSR